jgi:UDP-N-acetyl-D-mannosaminuronate dehydrogenase
VPGSSSADSLEDALAGAEALLLLVDHTRFKEIDPGWVSSITPARTVIDTRGIWDRSAWEQAGFRLITLGVGEMDA